MELSGIERERALQLACLRTDHMRLADRRAGYGAGDVHVKLLTQEISEREKQIVRRESADTSSWYQAPTRETYSDNRGTVAGPAPAPVAATTVNNAVPWCSRHRNGFGRYVAR